LLFALFEGYQQGYALIAARPSDRIEAFINHHHFHATNSEPSSYIEDGYNITLTDAPKDLGGRLRLNCARTTPELPEGSVSLDSCNNSTKNHTMWPGDLAPNDSDL
jgi:hypothetical protein